MSLLEVKNLSKSYKTVPAVKNVSFSIEKGETLGLVGESGSGKTTLGRMLLRLITPSSGSIFFQGEEITHKKDKALCRELQMIFQDPYASLNPRMTAKEIISEPLIIHKIKRDVDELFSLVGLCPSLKERYPHEFSGGQRQRIGIARAIALNPKFIVCDEPISALDISIQAQILNLLVRLQKELGLSLLFISHDLNAVKYISDRIAVMYQGQFVEIGPSEVICQNPTHPYTKLLLSSVYTNELKAENFNKASILDSGKEKSAERIFQKNPI